MLKIGTFLWILLAVILIAFPLILLFVIIFRRFHGVFSSLFARIRHITILKKFKEEIIFRKKTAVSQEDQQAVVVQEEEIPSLQDDGPVIVEVREEIDIIQNIVQAPAVDSPIPEQEDMVVDKESFLRNKKLLEKIVYEALVLRKEGKLDEYEKKLIEGLALDPNDKDLNRFLADYYFSVGNHKKALSLLKKIVELDPRDHKAIWQIGEIYLSSGDFETAELLLEKAITINPANPKYYVSMVELYYNTERKQDAIQQLEQIVKLRPTNPSYMLTLADLYLEIGDADSAQKYYFRVLEHEPSNEQAKRKLKDLVKE